MSDELQDLVRQEPATATYPDEDGEEYVSANENLIWLSQPAANPTRDGGFSSLRSTDRLVKAIAKNVGG